MNINISGLEQRIDSLINECKRLADENKSLRSSHEELITEKTELREKNRIARSRLEKIVEKLKLLETQ